MANATPLPLSILIIYWIWNSILSFIPILFNLFSLLFHHLISHLNKFWIMFKKYLYLRHRHSCYFSIRVFTFKDNYNIMKKTYMFVSILLYKERINSSKPSTLVLLRALQVWEAQVQFPVVIFILSFINSSSIVFSITLEVVSSKDNIAATITSTPSTLAS